MTRVLLLTPPMVQLNTPYPATAYLTGFLNRQGYETVQRDPAIELVTKLFCREGVQEIYEEIAANFEDEDWQDIPEEIQFFLENWQAYQNTVEPTMRFLQGKDPSLAIRICSRRYLPEGVGFAVSIRCSISKALII